MAAKICVDSLGGVKYPEVMKKLPKRYGSGYFWEEFGLAKGVVIQELKRGRELLRIQGLWAGSSHNYTSTHRSRSIQIAKALEKLAKQFGVKIYYSPYCEHRKDAKHMLALFKEISASCPSLILVNSPVKGGEWVDGYVNEIHHNDKPAGMPKGYYFFSMDGLHQPDCDIQEYISHLYNPLCLAFFVWALQHNCKPNAKPENNIPPKQRKTKPTVKLNNSLIFQLENKKQKVSLPDGWISKSHSEQHEPVDPRANKLVVISPKGKRFKVVKIGTYKLAYGGVMEDGRQTWRSSKWAMEMGRVLAIYADGKLIGTVDAPFRQNEWREKT